MADTYLYSRSRNAWFAKDAAGNIRAVPTSQVPQAQQDKIAKKYAGAGTVDEGDPTRTTLGIKIGPIGVSKATQTGITVAEKTQREKINRLAQDVLRQGLSLQNIYQTKIMPKIQSGQINPTLVGTHYAARGLARGLGQGELDPDVGTFITKTGQFATAVNSYYMQAGQGRASAIGYDTIVKPHVPHPPGFRETLGPEGNVPQWDLIQQGEQIDTIIDNVRHGRDPVNVDPGAAPPGPVSLPGDTGKPAPAATPSPTNLKPLPGGYRLDPSTGKVYAPSAAATSTAKPAALAPPGGFPIPVMKRRPLFNVPSASGTLTIPPVTGG